MEVDDWVIYSRLESYGYLEVVQGDVPHLLHSTGRVRAIVTGVFGSNTGYEDGDGDHLHIH